MLDETRLSAGLIAVWTIILTCTILAVRHEYKNTSPVSAHAATLPALRISGLRYQEYDTGGLAASISADRLAIVPRRFLFFNLKSINEAHLENAQIEIHLHNEVPRNEDMVPPVADMFTQHAKNAARRKSGSEFGVVTRSVVEGIAVKIYDADLPLMVLRAKRADVDRKRDKTRFQYAVLEDARSDRRIISKEIIWDARDRAFLIPGDYIAETASGNARSKGARVNLEYVVTPLLP